MQHNIRQQEQARDAEQRLDGPKADNALTLKPDHLMGHAMRRSGSIILTIIELADEYGSNPHITQRR